MKEIVVAGVGMTSTRHMTFEVAEALTQSNCVFHMVTGVEAVKFLQSINRNTYSLVGLYKDGHLDLDVYNQIASFLIAQAIAQHQIAFVVMGHPSIYVAPTHLLAFYAPKYGVNVRVLPGISSLDTIVATLPFDIGNSGLQILDANRIVSYALEPMSNTPLLVLQVGCFGSGYITRMQENGTARLSSLVEYLLNFYPGNHLIQLIECAMGSDHGGSIHTLPLSALAHNGHLATYNTTLYVPPATPISVKNQRFHEQLLNPQYVSSLLAR